MVATLASSSRNMRHWQIWSQSGSGTPPYSRTSRRSTCNAWCVWQGVAGQGAWMPGGQGSSAAEGGKPEGALRTRHARAVRLIQHHRPIFCSMCSLDSLLMTSFWLNISSGHL